MNKIIIFLTLFLIYNLNTLFCQGGFDSSGQWVDDSGEYYHKILYNFYNDEYINFHIYGDIELREIYESNNSDKTEFYVLRFYEPITFTKGFEPDRTLITVEEIQLLFSDDCVKNNIDLNWKGHIIDGKVYFSNDNYHTPLIIVAYKIRLNG